MAEYIDKTAAQAIFEHAKQINEVTEYGGLSTSEKKVISSINEVNDNTRETYLHEGEIIETLHKDNDYRHVTEDEKYEWTNSQPRYAWWLPPSGIKYYYNNSGDRDANERAVITAGSRVSDPKIYEDDSTFNYYSFLEDVVVPLDSYIDTPNGKEPIWLSSHVILNFVTNEIYRIPCTDVLHLTKYEVLLFTWRHTNGITDIYGIPTLYKNDELIVDKQVTIPDPYFNKAELAFMYPAIYPGGGPYTTTIECHVSETPNEGWIRISGNLYLHYNTPDNGVYVADPVEIHYVNGMWGNGWIIYNSGSQEWRWADGTVKPVLNRNDFVFCRYKWNEGIIEINTSLPAYIRNGVTVPITSAGFNLGKGFTRIQNPKLNFQKKEFRVLDIGNSYTDDATHYIADILRTQDVDTSNMCLYMAYRGSASLASWLDCYYDRDNADYSITKRAGGLSATISGTGGANNGDKFRSALNDNKWDLIIIHTYSYFSGDWTYNRWNRHDLVVGGLKGLIHTIKATNPQATIAYLLPHSYSSNYSLNLEKSSETRWYNYARAAMRLKADYGIDMIIPYGTAIQNMRKTSYNNDMDMTSDKTHCASGLPDYTAGCAYYQAVFAPRYGKSILGNTFRPTSTDANAIDVTDANAILAQRAAMYACEDPFYLHNPEAENEFITKEDTTPKNGDYTYEWEYALNKNVVETTNLFRSLDFKGTKCYFYGDSVTYGYTPSGRLAKPWPAIFKDMTGATEANNFASPEACWGTGVSDVDIWSQITGSTLNLNTTSEVLVIIAAGINDWAWGQSLDNFKESVEHVLSELKKNSYILPIVISPINNDLKYIDVNDRQFYDIYPYRKILFEMCMKYQVSFVDGRKLGFSQSQNKGNTYLLTDSVHPNQIGAHWYAYNFLKEVSCMDSSFADNTDDNFTGRYFMNEYPIYRRVLQVPDLSANSSPTEILLAEGSFLNTSNIRLLSWSGSAKIGGSDYICMPYSNETYGTILNFNIGSSGAKLEYQCCAKLEDIYITVEYAFKKAFT